jgi:amino acid adenylation domain-containing protein
VTPELPHTPQNAPPRQAVDLVARFHEAVRRSPDRIAVRDTDSELNFAELDRRTAGLASTLRSRGIERGDRVGVCLPRGLDLVIALLAAWRAGAAYVPLDPCYPHDRLAFMAGDAGIQALLSECAHDWQPDGVAVVSPAETAPESAWSDVPSSGLDPAYVIYTSGSTGRPKGVQARRGGVASLVGALEQAGIYGQAPRTVAWNASISFDASVQQWARVCRGDTLVIVDEEHRTEPARLMAWLAECAVTDLDLTPSHWDVLREHLLSGTIADPPLRLFIGGEPMLEPAWEEIAAACGQGRIEALNLYGPTECTVDATASWIEGSRPNIGWPLPGMRLYVLDSELRTVPVDVAGELYVAGPQLADGYLNQPALTAQHFLADPRGIPGGRMYRTGDQVRWSASGTLEFIGRVDRQVKLRGYRMELGEIEAVVRARPGVTGAAVVIRDDRSIGQRLVAYYVADTVLAADELRRHVAGVLPEFMVPAAFVRLGTLPLTPNGKLDTAALPAPEDVAATADRIGADPEGESEKLIAEVWSEVLGRDRISADDDFFALGGHSLVALRVVARLKRSYGLPISTKQVYRHPRLSDLARYVESLRPPAAGSE